MCRGEANGNEYASSSAGDGGGSLRLVEIVNDARGTPRCVVLASGTG
jgi:hypothetical protein